MPPSPNHNYVSFPTAKKDGQSARRSFSLYKWLQILGSLWTFTHYNVDCLTISWFPCLSLWSCHVFREGHLDEKPSNVMTTSSWLPFNQTPSTLEMLHQGTVHWRNWGTQDVLKTVWYNVWADAIRVFELKGKYRGQVGALLPKPILQWILNFHETKCVYEYTTHYQFV